MIDNLDLESLIRQQIASAVEQRVAAIMDQQFWLDAVENRIVQHVQDRITGRFANIETIPDLVATVERSVGSLFDQGRVPGIATFVDLAKITQTVDLAVEDLVASVIDSLTVDQTWLDKIQTQIDRSMTQRLLGRLHDIDMDVLISGAIDQGLDRWRDRLMADFHTRGIQDLATQTTLSVDDTGAQVSGQIQAHTARITQDAEVAGTLITNGLVVKGTINTDNRAWNELVEKVAVTAFEQTSEQWRQDLVAQVLDLARETNIDFASVSIQGTPIIKDNALCEHIVTSNLTRIGTLKDLTVTGQTSLAGTLSVGGRKVGINTDTPEMALSIWDEEVAVLAGKLSKNQAYIGTKGLSSLTIGVNRKAAIEVDLEGMTTVQALRIQRHRIGHSATVPGTSGTRGDILFNSDPKPNTAFAWVCLGGFKWQPLMATT